MNFSDSSLPESDRNQIIVGSTGLLLGLVFVFTGLIYYKRRSAARITLHHGKRTDQNRIDDDILHALSFFSMFKKI